jgi:hypothetical protein
MKGVIVGRSHERRLPKIVRELAFHCLKKMSDKYGED